MKRWLVKIRRYGGGTSVLTDYDDRAQAEQRAGGYNADYHTDAAYVEENTDYPKGEQK